MCRRPGFGRRGVGRARIAIASESKQAGGVSRAPAAAAQIILPPASHSLRLHTSFECASLWRRPGPFMILVRVGLISGRLNLTLHAAWQGKLKPAPDRMARATLALSARRCLVPSDPLDEDTHSNIYTARINTNSNDYSKSS